jgi:hypothetical protein
MNEHASEKQYSSINANKGKGVLQYFSIGNRTKTHPKGAESPSKATTPG